ncbi:hypothetical protein LXL04_021980 [Taraxacum kok-saghyz]
MGLPKPPSNLTSLPSFFLLLFITIHQSLSARTLGGLSSPPQLPPKNHHHHHKTMSFYMPNLLNLSSQHPSATQPPTKVNGQTIPFSKPVGIFPPVGGIPIPDSSKGSSYVTSQTSGLYGTGIGTNFPILHDELEFGMVNIIDVDLLESTNMYGLRPLGKAKGMYVSSLENGSNQMMALTTSFLDNEFADELRFFGVHRADVSYESRVAVIGGTGKYDGANGYATLKVVKVNSKAIKEDGEANDFLLLTQYKTSHHLCTKQLHPSHQLHHKLDTTIYSPYAQTSLHQKHTSSLQNQKNRHVQMAIIKLSISTILKTTLCIFLLAISLEYTNGARILIDTTDDFATSITPIVPLPTTQHDTTIGPIDEHDTPNEDPTPTLPSGQIPSTVTPTPVVNPAVPLPTKGKAATPVPVATPVGGGATPPVTTPVGGGAKPAGGSTTGATTSGGGAATGGGATVGGEHPTLSFFMHDVMGGSHATSRVVTGIVASSDANVVPFSTPNSQVFPITGGVPLNNINGIVNNNNLPFLAGFNGNNPNNPNSNTVLQNTGNNNVANGGTNLPYVAAGQLPAGITLQQLMFGSITVIDNELTEGHELGTGVIGQGQGFYLSSSLDGSSHTFALTTLFHGSDHEVDDTISFFGVHRTASEISHIAVIGGTGKYEEAKGYATIESIPQVDEHTTDGVETIVHVNVYLTTV